jgi:capsular polysaccharide transport system permease protein
MQSVSDAAMMRKAAATQARVIGALILRETRTRFGKSQLGYFWAVAEPVVGVLVFTLASGALRTHPAIGDSLALFFATGMLSFQAYRNVASFCTAAIDSNQALLAYPIVKQLDTIVARAILEFATSLLAMLILLGTLVLWWDAPLPAHLETVAASILLLSVLGFGHGTVSALIAQKFASWRSLDQMLSRALFIVSGIFYTGDSLPPVLRDALAWNPALQGVELMRSGYYGGYTSSVLDPLYLFLFAFGLVLIGLAFERASRVRPHRDA